MTASLRQIVVLNAHYTGLGIARSLAGLPVEVHTLTAETETAARSSRRLRLVYSPDTERNPQAAANYLIEYSAGLNDRALLIPTRDHDVHFLMQYRTSLEATYDLCIAPNDVLAQVMNKQRLFDVASTLGIHCPRSMEIDNRGALENAIATLAMPVVAKPLYSRDWRRPDVRRVVRKNKAFVLDTARGLRELYTAIEPLAPQLVVQEFVPGADRELIVYGSYVDASGNLRASFTGRKLLQHPRQCGNGVAIRAEKMAPEVSERSQALLSALRYRGVSELEFKRDQVTGRLALIEMNARHWDQHRLSDAVGASVTRAMYEDWLGGNPVAREQSRKPVTILVEDAWLRGMFDAMRGKEGSVGDFLRLLRPPLCGTVWDSQDPRPFFSMIRDVLITGRRPSRPETSTK